MAARKVIVALAREPRKRRDATSPAFNVRFVQKSFYRRKSGGKPTFLTLRLLDWLDASTLNAILRGSQLNSNQLGVRKVGLPPLFRAAETLLYKAFNVCPAERRS